MGIPFYQIDAFTDRLFGGNPAAVCVFDAYPDDARMQSIALENNLSETAFIVPEGDNYRLRWMTPTMEVDLCGHATLAAAYVVLTELEPRANRVRFQTMSGWLTVERAADAFRLELPARPPMPDLPEEVPAELAEGLGANPIEVLEATHVFLAVFDAEDDVRAMWPDMEILQKLEDRSVIVTAPGREVDFVSRYFGPCVGVPEDPVTGAAHCTLAPYWAKRLGKKTLTARQLSARGGELICEDAGQHVRLTGKAVLYARGELAL